MAIHNSFSTFKIRTNAPFMYIKANPTIYAAFASFAQIRIKIDNHPFIYKLYTIEEYKRIDLYPGYKTIEITESGCTKPTTTILGTFLISVLIPNGFTYDVIDEDTPENKLLFIGDSITTGGNATYTQQSYAMLFRDAGNNTSIHSYGYATLSGLASSEALITDTVSTINTLMDGSISNKLILLLGTNDFAILATLVATFQTQYSNLLTAINTARPDILIKAVSPLVRNPENPNLNGETLTQLRTAISNACSGKAYCTYIDGSTLMTTAGLQDDVHPTTAGHLTVYTNLSPLI